MKLSEYLKFGNEIINRSEQRVWFRKLSHRVQEGLALFAKSSPQVKAKVQKMFSTRIRTEELKAWYSSPEDDSLFQGTSISSLTIPCELEKPLELTSITQLEEAIANAYIRLHDKYAPCVRKAILEDVSTWIQEGLYYGVVLSSKIISQSFGLFMSYEDVVFNVNGILVDPHEITSYPLQIRQLYFKECLRRLSCFKGLDLCQQELESSLVLADVSKPRMIAYHKKIILAPVRCNEIAAILSERLIALIIKKTDGKIKPRGLTVVIYDTDTPYTYHQVMGYCRNEYFPVLPGLIVLGASGTIDAYRWLYTYRLSLITQKIMKSSLFSQVHECFIPFVFFGVLVPRDAEILLDMNNLHRLRYRGNINPELEFAYLFNDYLRLLSQHQGVPSWHELKTRHIP